MTDLKKSADEYARDAGEQRAYLAGARVALEMAAKAADARSGMFGTAHKPVDASAKAIASAIRSLLPEVST